MKVVWLGLTVGAAVSRLEAPAVAPAGNPSCCSACEESPFIEHLFAILSIFKYYQFSPPERGWQDFLEQGELWRFLGGLKYRIIERQHLKTRALS